VAGRPLLADRALGSLLIFYIKGCARPMRAVGDQPPRPHWVGTGQQAWREYYDYDFALAV